MQPIKIFCSCAHNSPEDERYVNDLEKHLASLRHQGQVDVWHVHKTSPGVDLEHEILTRLRDADIILLLISPDYMNSDHCFNIEAKQAVRRERMGIAEVRVILLRHIDWEGAPFSQCQVLPKNRKFVSKLNKHEAFLDIVQGIKEIVQEIQMKRSIQETKPVQFGPPLNETHVITAMPPPEAIMRNRQTEEPKLIRQTEELKRNKRTEELQPRKQPARARNSRQLLADESSSSEFADVPKKKALPGIKSSSGKSVVRNSNKLRPADRTHWSKRISYEYRYVSKGNYGIFLFSMLVFDVVGMPATIWGWSNSAGLFWLTLFISLTIFISGTINIYSFVAIPLALLYAGAWWGIIQHFLSWPLLVIFIICAPIALIHFLLFREHRR